MTQVALVIEFRVKPGGLEELGATLREHARLTRAEEPGCERFDVLVPRDDQGAADPSRLLLFELYRDQAALDTHRANPRMPVVAAVIERLIEERTRNFCTVC